MTPRGDKDYPLNVKSPSELLVDDDCDSIIAHRRPHYEHQHRDWLRRLASTHGGTKHKPFVQCTPPLPIGPAHLTYGGETSTAFSYASRFRELAETETKSNSIQAAAMS